MDSTEEARDEEGGELTAEELASLPEVRPVMFYNLACVMSLSAAAVRTDEELEEADREHREEEYATRAMEFLAAGRDGGHFDSPRNVEHMKSDSDFDVLRPREGFEELVSELEKKKETVEEQAPE